MKRYSLTETAVLIRKALKAAFPATKFSVRSQSYSMGCSINVSWTDGPTGSDVDEIVDRFEGATFDGMTDSKGYREPSEFDGDLCTFGTDYVHTSRHESEVLLQIAAYRVHKETKLPLLEVKDRCVKGGSYSVPFSYFRHNGLDVICHDEKAREFYDQLVYQVARRIAVEKRADAPAPAVPELITDEFIAAKIEGMIQ